MRFLVAAALAVGAAATVGCAADPIIVSVSRLDATVDPEGPYAVEAVVDGAGDDDVRLIYSAEHDGRASLASRVMRADGDALFTADIPGQPAPTTVRYYVVALEGDEEVDRMPASGEYAFDVLE